MKALRDGASLSVLCVDDDSTADAAALQKCADSDDAVRRKTQNLLNMACALDGADWQLLPSTFRALERELQLQPTDLGQLSLYQCLFQSLSAPLWGFLADRYSRPNVLCVGCVLWGVVTIVLAASSTLWEMAILRSINGIALASVGPLSQSMIADLFAVDERGIAFGWVQLSQNFGGIIGSLVITTVSQMALLGVSGWRVGFIMVGLMSVGLGVVICASNLQVPRHSAPMTPTAQGVTRVSRVCAGVKRETRKLMRSLRKPSFWCLAGQGIFGAVPWNAMSWFTMYFQYMKMEDGQAAVLWAALQAGGGLGGLLGGYVGDKLAKWSDAHGRPLAAQLSVFLGIPTTAIILQLMPRLPEWFFGYFVLMLLLGLVASWCPSATNRPVLTDIVDPCDRATIFSWLVAIEGSSAALFGVPTVALLAKMFYGYKMQTEDVKSMAEEVRTHNLNALANSLTVAMLIPWSVCFVVFGSLHFTYKRDRVTPTGSSSSGVPYTKVTDSKDAGTETDTASDTDTDEADIIQQTQFDACADGPLVADTTMNGEGALRRGRSGTLDN